MLPGPIDVDVGGAGGGGAVAELERGADAGDTELRAGPPFISDGSDDDEGAFAFAGAFAATAALVRENGGGESTVLVSKPGMGKVSPGPDACGSVGPGFGFVGGLLIAIAPT